MAQADVDPDELERFARSLDAFIDELDGAVGGLDGSFNAVSDSWRDSQRDSYEEFHNELKACVSRFNDNARDKVSYLLVKAAQAREYLGS